jgi:nitroreductase
MNPHGSFLQNLEWRRAVKQFGPEPVDPESVALIVNAMVNAPSSFGLQPYRILAVQNGDLKRRLRAVSYDQPQVTECHTLFVLCARTDLEARVEEYLQLTKANIARAAFSEFLSELPDRACWAMNQAYIALGFGLAACAELHVASCPMGGFQAEDVRVALGLPDHQIPCVMLAIGSFAEQKKAWPRFRFPTESMVEYR